MYPYIHVFGKTIPSYGLMGILGVLSGWLYVWIRCKKEDSRLETDSVILYMYGAVGALIGAKVFFLLQNLPGLIGSFRSGLEGVWRFISANLEGGMVFYGGLIGALLFVLFYARHYKIRLKNYLFILVPALPLAHGIGRIGCYLAGCCHGHIGPVPVQLAEATCNLLLCVGLTVYSKKQKDGRIILAAYLLLYGTVRFILEFFREDIIRGFLGPLSTSQILSVAAFIFGGWLLFKSYFETPSQN